MQPNPLGVLMQVFAFIVGALVLAVSALLGFFLLAGILGFALIAGVVFYARLWWLRRKLRARMAERRRGEAADGEYIEAEYRVVREVRRD